MALKIEIDFCMLQIDCRLCQDLNRGRTRPDLETVQIKLEENELILFVGGLPGLNSMNKSPSNVSSKRQKKKHSHKKLLPGGHDARLTTRVRKKHLLFKTLSSCSALDPVCALRSFVRA